jgi:hypothetical protein
VREGELRGDEKGTSLERDDAPIDGLGARDTEEEAGPGGFTRPQSLPASRPVAAGMRVDGSEVLGTRAAWIGGDDVVA